jgi:3-oxoacyl-[acyl-carrier-protein] synthase-3
VTATALRPLRCTSASARGGRIRGIGATRPSRVLTGEELAARVGRSAEWIRSRTGIARLGVLGADQSLPQLAVDAGRDALRAAATSEPPDLVLVASCSNREPRAPVAPQVAAALAPAAATLDLNAACAGFCYSLSSADALIRTGAAARVLLVAAETMTGLVDPTDPGTSIIFGDGAGAVLLDAADDEIHVGPVAWGSDGAQSDLIAINEPGGHMTMAGRQVFRWAVEHIHHVARRACDLAGITLGEIDAFIPHQANLRIIEAMANRLGLADAVIARDVVTSGNTSAASIPLALDAMYSDGALRGGELALAVGFGAGLSYAAQVLRLPRLTP